MVHSKPKLLRGVIIATPQNEKTHGWIYCKSTNNTYQLPWSDNTHFMVDQVVLFRPNHSLRGLRVEEARSLMLQNKLDIKRYNDYFVADHLSTDIARTTLLDLDEIHSRYLTVSSESKHSETKFILNTVLDVREGTEIEFKCLDAQCPSSSSNLKVFPMHKMVNVMERYLNGFINMNGGTIYFGITAEGRIVGQDLHGGNARKLVDELEVKMCEKLREWRPSQYVQKLVKSVEIEMIDIVQIDEEEQVGFVLPHKKVISAHIMPIARGDGVDGVSVQNEENVVFSSSERNGGAVYVRQLSSLCAYTDRSMRQQIGKRQIDKLNIDGDSDSEIDFDDDDERDYVVIEGQRRGAGRERSDGGYLSYFDGQTFPYLSNLWRNMQRALPL